MDRGGRLRVLLCAACLLVPGIMAGDKIDLAQAACNVTVSFLRAQSEKNPGNLVLSPSSVLTFLGILQQGARENTQKQLDDLLGLTPEEFRNGFGPVVKSLLQEEKKNVTLELANRAYIRPGFVVDEQFNKTITEVFGANIEELNFVEPSTQAAADAINKWVKEATHDNIHEFVAPAVLTPDTVFVLLTAIYFKGLWDVPFKKSLTKEEKFENVPGNMVTVPFMAQKERFIAGEDAESGVQWVDLPFKDEKYSMLFMLPQKRHGLSEFLTKLNGELLRNVINDEQTRQVTMQLPKFKLSQKSFLAGALQELGVTDVFTSNANLTGITPNYNNLVVSKIIHQASVEIDEDGSTASAATGGFTEVTSFPKSSDHLDFKADHPFLFFILDRVNKVPLFVGKVEDPSVTT